MRPAGNVFMEREGDLRMRRRIDDRGAGAARARARATSTTIAVAAALGLLVGAAPAPAKKTPNPEFAPFADCPVGVHGVRYCVYADTTSGEFKVGSKTVTINKPITLQGGLMEGSEQLVPATDGDTLTKTPLTVPGGLVGIEGLGGEVTATTEIAGPVLVNEANVATGSGPVVTLPARVKLSNPALGETCYIGSDAEPILLKLITGTTNPPPPNKPITGSPGSFAFNPTQEIAIISNTSLVDNSFAAPGVNGCGEPLSAVLDPVVDLAAGLPSAAGGNTAILNGTVEEAAATSVKKSHVIPKEKKPKP